MARSSWGNVRHGDGVFYVVGREVRVDTDNGKVYATRGKVGAAVD